ncbi:MAG TPA: dihydrolipoyl dehydrogenase [Dehalococcoidia bacterium]|nr:dihydrolipoyl dehydrogenase [Dehalococcoidia bacterium]
MAEEKQRVAVIGAGPGGYPAAFLAAERGFDVTLIDERPQPGGVCLYDGCIPSKALLHVAELVHDASTAELMGLRFGEPEIDLDQLRQWKQKEVVARMTGGLAQIAKARKVRYLQGRAHFVSPTTLRVALDGEVTDLECDYAVIATGSLPAIPEPLRLDADRVWDSTRALQLPEVPQRLLIVGGGYIGLEMATVYAALGSSVTVVEMTGSLLPGSDPDLTRILANAIKERLQEILLLTRVESLQERKQGIEARLTSADLDEAREYDAVLIATGRRPNAVNLGLDATAVKVDQRGFIEVDHQRRTAEPTIFAVGDVVGEPMLAHKATHEARVAIESMAGDPASWDPAAIPAVVFTDPEIAWCGLTESEASARGIEVAVTKFPWAASGRATTMAQRQGVTKLIVEPGTDRILGVGIAGRGAGELIGEGVLAVEMGARLDDLRLTIHSHPTLSETLMESAEVFFGVSPHYIGKRR